MNGQPELRKRNEEKETAKSEGRSNSDIAAFANRQHEEKNLSCLIMDAERLSIISRTPSALLCHCFPLIVAAVIGV